MFQSGSFVVGVIRIKLANQVWEFACRYLGAHITRGTQKTGSVVIQRKVPWRGLNNAVPWIWSCGHVVPTILPEAKFHALLFDGAWLEVWVGGFAYAKLFQVSIKPRRVHKCFKLDRRNKLQLWNCLWGFYGIEQFFFVGIAWGLPVKYRDLANSTRHCNCYVFLLRVHLSVKTRFCVLALQFCVARSTMALACVHPHASRRTL